jgi:hypothetical protein
VKRRGAESSRNVNVIGCEMISAAASRNVLKPVTRNEHERDDANRDRVRATRVAIPNLLPYWS